MECVFDEDEEDDEDDGDGEGLELAACATAAPPPIRTPESVAATIAFRNQGLMSVHLLSWLLPAQVNGQHLRDSLDPAQNAL